MDLLTAFESLLATWNPIFPQQRTFQRAYRLTFGLLACLRRPLTLSAICTTGRQFLDWTADRQPLLAQSRLSPLSPAHRHQARWLSSSQRLQVALSRSAFLICSDSTLPIQTLLCLPLADRVQSPRRKIFGVAEGQIRSPEAVDRLPRFQVATYSLLQLASLIAYGFGRAQDFLPLPKWRRQSARPSAADLIDLLRSHLLRRSCSSPPPANFIHFDFMPPLQANRSKIPQDLCEPAANRFLLVVKWPISRAAVGGRGSLSHTVSRILVQSPRRSQSAATARYVKRILQIAGNYLVWAKSFNV